MYINLYYEKHKILSIKGYIARNKYDKACEEYQIAKNAYEVALEKKISILKELLEVEGIYEWIEVLAETDRDKANEWIILLNKIKAM